MVGDHRNGEAKRPHGARGFQAADSRDERSAAGETPPPARPQVDARRRAVITPNGFPLYL